MHTYPRPDKRARLPYPAPAGWPTPPNSPQRSRIKFVVVQGALKGAAVAIVGSKGCPGRSPAVPPSHHGSQLFV